MVAVRVFQHASIVREEGSRETLAFEIRGFGGECWVWFDLDERGKEGGKREDAFQAFTERASFVFLDISLKARMALSRVMQNQDIAEEHMVIVGYHT